MSSQQVVAPWPADLSSYCFEVPYSEQSILFESASGVRLVDATGKRYLDGLSGVFVTCFGYDCEPIVTAVTKQVQTMAFNPPLHGTNKSAIELSRRLVDLAPEGITAAKLVNGGSEAVEAAIRLARLHHASRGNQGKLKVLSHYHGYHGATFGSLSVTGRPDVTRFGPGLPGVVHVWPPDCLESFFGVPHEDSGALAAAMIERTIEAEGPDSVAALVLEPVIHLRGMAVPPADYLPKVREVCDRHDVTLIFDEIVTGFGRTGAPFAAQTFGVTPDLICAGKGISGGYAPLAAVLIGEHIAGTLGEPGGPVSFAPSHTYAANPVASAAGLAAVELFESSNALDSVARLSERTASGLRALLAGRGELRAAGLLFGVTVRPHSGPDPEAGSKVAAACLRRGLIVRGQDDWIVLAPPYVAEDADIDEILSILGEALDEVCGGAA
ncbi:aspartate aminotransferase family protein [Saccharopolyspora erythraea]|uniref:aminotransferase family protein n=1 Tax=Saccharopolyspora erythraea TaxID=1836 RepID=UPI001BA7A304|nr:aminotransferase class III-fold pyridoxal phosphate-dependent enzyme [Saccharopolyspora erythraea]QUH01951.1 aspartate aminotransferase family protein [Saccharopolyspora erythraea]